MTLGKLVTKLGDHACVARAWHAVCSVMMLCNRSWQDEDEDVQALNSSSSLNAGALCQPASCSYSPYRWGAMAGAQQNGDVSRPLLDETRACGDPVTVDIEEATGAICAVYQVLLSTFSGQAL